PCWSRYIRQKSKCRPKEGLRAASTGCSGIEQQPRWLPKPHHPIPGSIRALRSNLSDIGWADRESKVDPTTVDGSRSDERYGYSTACNSKHRWLDRSLRDR